MATVRYLVHDLDAAAAYYRDRLGFTAKRQFGPGGRQVVIEDPSGNPTELFEVR